MLLFSRVMCRCLVHKSTTEAEINEALWSDTDRLLLSVIDQLTLGGVMQPDTLAGFREQWTLDQQLEIFALAGTYQTISYVATHAELGLDRFSAKFSA